MTEFNMYEAKTNLSRISKMLEEKKEDCVIISRNGKPILKVTLVNENPRKNFIGCAEGMFEIPEDFDDIDISDDFEGEVFPQ